MNQKSFFTLLLLLSVFASNGLFAQEFKTKSVSVFKNGQSFFQKSGNLESTSNSFFLPEDAISHALFGSLWFDAPNNEIRLIKSYPDTIETTEQIQAVHFAELLQANIGKEMVLHLTDGSQIKGTLENLPRRFDPATNRDIPVQMILFKTSEGWLTFHLAEISKFDFAEKPNLQNEVTKKQAKYRIEIVFDKPKSKQDLDLMYLRNGLVWAPEYFLELKSETKASLTLQAEIANNSENLQNINLNLVVGVPNFKYANESSWILDFMKTVAVRNNRQIQNGFMNVSANPITYSIDQSAAASPFSSNSDDIGNDNEDLFVYSFPNFSLPKGGRALQHIFKDEIEIAHIYEVNLPGNNVPNKNQNFFFQPSNKNPVVHTIRIDNQTNNPWTTGAVFVSKPKDGIQQPISQDLLNYTPSKGHSFIKLTEAPDVKINHKETQVKREKRVLVFPKENGYHYDLITVEGSIKIKNHKRKAIDMNVRKTISGKLLSSSLKYLEQIPPSIRHSPNQITNFCWEPSIEAGGTLTITYTYQMYARS